MNQSKNRNKAILYLVISALGFAIMNTFVRFSGDLPTFQKAFIRNLVILVFSTMVMLKTKDRFFPKKENFWLMVGRAFLGNVGMIANYYAVDHLIMSDATIIAKLAPFFTIILSFIILKEEINFVQIACIIVSFIGALFVIRPTFDINLLPAGIGVLGAFCAGFAYTLVRSLGQRGEKNSTIVFCFAFFSALFNLPLMIFNYKPMAPKELISLLLAGLFAYIAQMALTEAYSLAPSREISIFDYSQLLFAGILGYFIFSEVPDMFSVIGYLIILASSLVLFIKNNKDDEEIKTGK